MTITLRTQTHRETRTTSTPRATITPPPPPVPIMASPKALLLCCYTTMITIILVSQHSSSPVVHAYVPIPLSRTMMTYGSIPHSTRPVFSRHTTGPLSSSSSSSHDSPDDKDRTNGKKETSSPQTDDDIPSFPTPNEIRHKNNISEKEFDRAVLKARAQATIDAILDSPEAPFDLSTELDKLAPTPPTPPTTTSNQTSIEQTSHQLETSMYHASSLGDYSTAQTHKTALERLHMDDVSNVLHANSQFYRAFSNKDYDAMEGLWLHDSVAVCVHPAREPLVGAGDILRSWKNMFGRGSSGGAGGGAGGGEGEEAGAMFQRNLMEPVNIRLNVRGTIGIVTCDEEVYTRRFIRAGSQTIKKESSETTPSGKARSGRTQGMELVNQLIATNVFRKVGEKWYMVHHHSAWHANSEAARTSRINAADSDMERMKQRLPSATSALEGLTAEGVLGIPGHEGFYDGKKKGGKGGMGGGMDGNGIEQVGGIKRVFTGSLDELLNGGWKDVLGGGDGAEDGEEQIILEEDDDEDDGIMDAIQEETIIISNGAIAPSGQNIGNGMGFGGVSSSNKDGTSNKNSNNNKNDKNNGGGEDSSKDSLRQSCIAALRNLATKGTISQKQKRTLLTDIILSSAKGEYSMVEVAYDLLCGEDGDNEDDNDVGGEEFAEQCRVFAQALPELPPLKSR